MPASNAEPGFVYPLEEPPIEVAPPILMGGPVYTGARGTGGAPSTLAVDDSPLAALITESDRGSRTEEEIGRELE